MRFDIEHPDITLTLLTGYPYPEEDEEAEEEIYGYDYDRAYDEARDRRYFGD